MKIKVKGTLIETNDILTISEIEKGIFGGGEYYKFIIKFKNQSELNIVIQLSDYDDRVLNKDMKERIQKIYDFVCKYWVGEGVLIPEII